MNRCDNCIHNNREKARQMFFINYCTLWNCQTSGTYHCKYRKRKETRLLFFIKKLAKTICLSS